MSQIALRKVRRLNRAEDRIISQAESRPKPRKPKATKPHVPPTPSPAKPKPSNVPKKKRNAPSVRVAKKRSTAPFIGPTLPPSDRVAPTSRQSRNAYPNNIDQVYDNWFIDASAYTQTILHPALVTGVGVPKGSWASQKWHVSFREEFKTDANGNFFACYGAGRGWKDATVSYGNACSMVPNHLRGSDTALTGNYDWTPSIGNALKPTGTLALDDIFNPAQLESLALPADAANFCLQSINARMVSWCLSVVPLGTVVEAKGAIYIGQLPYDYFPPDTTLSNLPKDILENHPGTTMIPGNALKPGSVTFRPSDDNDLQYKEIYEQSTEANEYVELLTGAIFILILGAEANMPIELINHINYESLGKSSAFMPGLSPGMDDAMMVSEALTYAANVPAWSEKAYTQVGGGAGGNTQSRASLHFPENPTWHPDSLTVRPRQVRGRSIKTISPPKSGTTHPASGGLMGTIKSYLHSFATEYIPMVAKIATTVAPLLV